MQQKEKGPNKQQHQPSNKIKQQARSTQSSRMALQKGLVSQLQINKSREHQGQLATNFSSHITLLKQKTELLEDFYDKKYISNKSEKLNQEYYQNNNKKVKQTKSVLDLISQEYAQSNERLQVKTTRNLYVGGFLQEKHRVPQQLAAHVNLSSENISKPKESKSANKSSNQNTTPSCILEGGAKSGVQNNSNQSNNKSGNNQGSSKIQIQTSGGMQNYPKPSMNLQMQNRHQAPQALLSKRGSTLSKLQNDVASQSSGGAYHQTNTLGNCTSSVGTAKSHGTMNATVSQSSNTKRVYQYCIDTRQIITMIDFAAKMIAVGHQEIQNKAEQLEKAQLASLTNREIIQEIYQQRSKSNSEDSHDRKNFDKNEKRNSSQNKAEETGAATQNLVQARMDIFCAGNKDLKQFAIYLNQSLKEQLMQASPTKTKSGKSELFKKTTSTKFFDRSKNMDFARLFALDDESQKNLASLKFKHSGTALSDPVQVPLMVSPRFTYFVENEKILTRQMFFVELQRETFVKDLNELKALLQNFIQRKYKNVGVTKIGFSSERELFNIFNKMFNNKKGFFNKISVRKILGQFWMSVRDIFQGIRLRTGAQTINNIGQFDEFVLKNNFYSRLEIVARGRFIYEPHLQENLGMDEHLLQINSSSHKDSSSVGSNGASNCTKFYNILYPIHQAIFESNLRHLSKLLKQEVEGVFYCERNQLDPCGNTPLILAVKLGNIDAVKILSDMYTCPKLRSLDELMNAKEIAIAMKSQPILKILISSNQKIKQQFFEQNKEAIFKVLEKMPDFKVDLNLTCDSNWFPVFSSVAPSDTYKIYKCGSNLRLDMTLLGLQKFNLIKGNISVLYKGRGTDNEGNLLIIDNKLQTVSNIFNRNKENKINTEIQDILTGKQILKKYQTLQVQQEMESEKSKKINGYESQKFILKSRYNMIKYQMNLAQIEQINGLDSFDQYVDMLLVDYIQLIQIHIGNQEEKIDQSNNSNLKSKFGPPNAAPLTSRPNLGGTARVDNNVVGGLSSRERSKFANFDHYNYTQEDHIERKQNQVQQNKQISIKKKTLKNISASLWLSKSYPFDLQGFLPLIHVLSFCSKQIRQFNKFLLKYPLPEKCFPVEARIPLFMSMEAIFSFKNMEMGFSDLGVFNIDKEVAVKQSQNMAIFAKQQISYLNMNSVDTQEDKQAKALKEIYKLCKTDEGDHSNDSHDNLYKGMNQIQEGYDSENSDRIKELFNRMMTNQDDGYDINIDNNNENSRNHAQGVGMSDIRKSLTHSDLLKLRKSGFGSIVMGRTPSKQMSINSDLSESVGVSERSFNDKLAKLQIHSFQNVKFMSQFKHDPNGENMQRILAAQLGDAVQQLSQLEQFQAQSALTRKVNKVPHHRQNISSYNSSMNHENIYDSKINEERPKINKSLGKHQINNNLHMWTKAGAKIYKEGQWINSQQHEFEYIQQSGGRPINIANQLSKFGQISQSAATVGTVSGSTVMHPFQPRTVPRLRANFPGDQQCSSIEGHSNSDMSSIMGGSGMMQSMSNLSNLQVGGPQSSYGHKQVGSGSTVVSGSQGLCTKLGGGASTNDSSDQHRSGNHGTQASINSVGSRRQPAIELSKHKPSILDKNKLKLILENLRNDHPQKQTPNSNNNHSRPRYLNTIESEGNLPTQFGERKDNKASMLSKASKADLSQRSIHSLESLQSEGSLEEEKKMQTANSDYNFGIEGTNEQLQQNLQGFGYEKTRKETSSQHFSNDNSQRNLQTLNIFQKLGHFIQESITDRKHEPNNMRRSNEDDLFNMGVGSKKLKKLVRSPMGAKGSPMTAKQFDLDAPVLRVDVNNTEQSENKNMVQPNRFLSEK